MDLAGAAQAIVETLNAAGVRATTDGRDANPPVVQIRPPTVNYRFGKGCWTADWEAWLIVPDTGMTTNMRALGDLLTDVQDALGGAVVTARPESIVVADGATLPAYVATWSDRIPAT